MDKKRNTLASPVLILNLNIGGGVQKQLTIYNSDIPSEAVHAFVSQYQLNPKLESLILQQVFGNLQQLLQEELTESPGRGPAEHSPSASSASLRVSTLPYANSGERLYRSGLISQEKSKVKSKNLQERLFQEESKDLTFRPKINHFSSLLASRSLSKTESRSNLGKLKNEQLTRDYQDCTFSPLLNPLSHKLMEYRDSITRDMKFAEMYAEGHRRRERREFLEKEFYNNQFPFKPEISASTVLVNQDSVVERLLGSRASKEEFLIRERLRQNAVVDASTGQKLFQPKTGRPPKKQRNCENLPVGEYLYSKSLVTKTVEPETHSTEQITNQHSEKILLDIKIKNYFEVFQALGPDENGDLHGERIDVQALDPAIERFVEPLVEEIRRYERPLEFTGFVEGMERLLSTLTPAEKSVFYTRKREVAEESSVSVLRKSFVGGPSIYERHVQKQGELEEKAKKQKERQNDREVAGCTFHPVLTPYSKPPKVHFDYFDFPS